MRRALDYLVLDPLRQRHLGLWKLRMSQVLHERTNGAFDDVYVKWSRIWSPPLALGEPRFIDTAAVDLAISDLRRDGCSVLPRKLSDADIEEITSFAFVSPELPYIAFHVDGACGLRAARLTGTPA